MPQMSVCGTEGGRGLPPRVAKGPLSKPRVVPPSFEPQFSRPSCAQNTRDCLRAQDQVTKHELHWWLLLCTTRDWRIAGSLLASITQDVQQQQILVQLGCTL